MRERTVNYIVKVLVVSPLVAQQLVMCKNEKGGGVSHSQTSIHDSTHLNTVTYYRLCDTHKLKKEEMKGICPLNVNLFVFQTDCIHITQPHQGIGPCVYLTDRTYYDVIKQRSGEGSSFNSL